MQQVTIIPYGVALKLQWDNVDPGSCPDGFCLDGEGGRNQVQTVNEVGEMGSGSAILFPLDALLPHQAASLIGTCCPVGGSGARQPANTCNFGSNKCCPCGSSRGANLGGDGQGCQP